MWSEEGNRSSHQSGASTATNVHGVRDDGEMVVGIPTPVTGTNVAIVMDWTDGLWSVRSSRVSTKWFH